MFVVALTRLGIMTTDKLRKNRRIGYFICGVVGMAVAPSVDPVTTVARRPSRCSSSSSSRSGSRVRSTAAPTRLKPPRSRRDASAVSAGWVLPVDGPPLEDGYVAWEDGRIVEVGRGRGRPPLRRDAIILPGIVNAHSHLEYAVYAGLRRRSSRSATGSPRTSRRKRVLDARRDGRDRAPRRRRVARRRHHDDRRLQLLGRRGRRPPPSSGCGRSSTSRSSAPTPSDAAARFEELRARIEETELVRIGISPHAPYTCSLDVYRWCLSLGIPVGTHLAESDGENEWLEHGTGPLAAAATCSSRRPGSAPSGRSRRCSAPSSSARTASRSTPDEIALLAAADVPVAHCPRSNALLGCGIAPLAELRAAGVRVGLGTDSPASTPSFDPWDEMRAAIAGARARERRPDALAPPTRCGSRRSTRPRALGLDARARQPHARQARRPDRRSRSPEARTIPIEDPSVAAVFGGSPAGVLETIVDGKTRYRQGETAWQEVRSTASAARRECSP